MTNQQGAPEAMRPIARYKIGYATDDWGMRSSTPGGIQDPAGGWVRYEDHVAAMRAQQPAPSAAVALSDDLRDRLVAISEAIADQDDRAVQAMLREILAAPQPSPTPQADIQPAPQGETNAQLDIDSNSSAPGQQRDVAGSVALGQPVGNGSDQAAGHTGAQGDKLLIVAERNIRSFLRSAVFKSESDREAALNCVDVLWEAASAPADSQPAPVRDYPPLPARRRAFLCTKCGGSECEPGTLNETHPTCKCGYLGFAEDLDFTADDMRAYVDADRAARGGSTP